MPVTKRTRFEVLRRDGFKCRYCGAPGPEGAGLTIDHVNPVSLGGSDGPENLVAACKDCNAGKASSNPDAPLVAQVSDDAVRWAAAMKAAADAELLTLQTKQGYRRAFLAGWKAWDGALEWLDSNWMSTLQQFQQVGLPVAVLLDDVDLAWGNQKIPERNTFRYMAGIAWNQITTLQANARASVEADAPSSPEPCGHCPACRDGGSDECRRLRPLEDGEERTVCSECGDACCPFQDGVDAGMDEGWRQGYYEGDARARTTLQRHHVPDLRPARELRAVVDGEWRSSGLNVLPAPQGLPESLADLEEMLARGGVAGALAEMAERDPWISLDGDH